MMYRAAFSWTCLLCVALGSWACFLYSSVGALLNLACMLNMIDFRRVCKVRYVTAEFTRLYYSAVAGCTSLVFCSGRGA